MHRIIRTESTAQTNCRLKALFAMSALLLGCALAACDLLSPGGTSGLASLHPITPNDMIEIEEGTSVLLGRGGPLLSFEDVSEDSRCPENVMCFWAGRAVADFRFADEGTDTSFILTLPGLTPTPYEQNDEVHVNGFTFKLLDVQPYPVFTYPLPDRERRPPPYRALVHILSDTG